MAALDGNHADNNYPDADCFRAFNLDAGGSQEKKSIVTKEGNHSNNSSDWTDYITTYGKAIRINVGMEFPEALRLGV